MTDHGPPRVRFALLGPLQAWNGHGVVSLGPVQQQVVLAVLLLHANRPVSRTAMVQAIWGDAAPASAVNLIQRHVSGLRRVLEPDGLTRASTRRLVWTGPGYLLTVETEDADLSVFEHRLSEARQARTSGDLPSAAQSLHSALRLWRGPVCEGLTSPLLEAERDRLAEWRLSAVEERIELDLLLGHDPDPIAELRRLVVDHPLRERLHGLLMQALYRTGRQGEALTVFQKARHALRDELGIEPAGELQDLHQRILRADPSLRNTVSPGTHMAAPPAPAPTPASAPAPAQLPRTVPQFSGRDEEIEQLRRVIDDDTGRIAVIVGTPGVGKTTLALHCAHQVRDHFPDGQLYVNLRGFGPTSGAMEPAEALQGFLEALGVSADQIPATVSARSAMYRTLLQDRRLLVLLDNALDADQVRPLLPGSPTCRVIVTSRNALSGLVAEVAAQPLRLDVLTPERGRLLLADRIGPDRVAAEPAAVAEIVRICAGLPLALAIVAARAVAQPRFSLTSLAAQLPVRTEGLDAFVNDDEHTDVRAVISWSCTSLDAQAARLFRLMAMHPGPDLTVAAAASILGGSPGPARSATAALVRAHLVEERSPGRFGFHDLLRAYATEQAEQQESEADRRAALHRMLMHYLGTSAAADQLLSPARAPLAPLPEIDGVTCVELVDRDQALQWVSAELPTLLAAVDLPPEARLDDCTWDLIWGLETFLDRRGQSRERPYEDAYNRYTQTLQRARRADRPMDQAQLHIRLNWVLERLERFDAGLLHAQCALDLFTGLGQQAGMAQSMNAIGWCHAKLGNHEQALHWCGSALSLNQELGQRDSEAHTWDSLGYIYDRIGAYRKSIECYREAVELWRELGVPSYEAQTLDRMGNAHEAEGELDNARVARRSAQLILADTGTYQ